MEMKRGFVFSIDSLAALTVVTIFLLILYNLLTTTYQVTSTYENIAYADTVLNVFKEDGTLEYATFRALGGKQGQAERHLSTEIKKVYGQEGTQAITIWLYDDSMNIIAMVSGSNPENEYPSEEDNVVVAWKTYYYEGRFGLAQIQVW